MTINWDYIAGFTDGEAYIGIVGRGPRVTLGQKDIRPLEAINEFLINEGYNPIFYQRKQGLYILSLFRRDEVRKFCEIMIEKSVLKYSDCEKVIQWMDDNPSRADRGRIDIEKFVELVNQGYTIKEVASMLGCSYGKLYRFYKKYGVSFKSRSGGVVIDGKHAEAMTKDEYKVHRANREKNKNCLDCNKPIYPDGKRCIKCAAKYRQLTKQESLKTSDIKYAQIVTSQLVEQEKA